MLVNKQSNNRVLTAFQSCRDGLVRSIMKMSVEQQDVDDILQETFIRVLDSDAKQQIKSPKGYLFVVSRNLVLKKLMQQSKAIHTELDDALIEDDDENTVEKDLYQKLKFERFNQVLSSLPEKQRRAILLRKLYCLSHKEIANKMDVSVSSIEKYIAQGLKQCKQSLCAQGYEVDELKLPVHLNQSSEEQTK
ncbi:RNA polymerase sigma factor [Cognaticolwellia beringensis]|uniref:RNA polymerase sigma factor n=1 Tax=Cognaticolwellia beringensis TaxID=1967665 RepID=A0A222GCG8_9GAMM|nr:RNA polymerase sigma factor [Cognaticolwellia beringensis]ASP49363.1 RNA polymerase sigma factor [Cognaticolwellia beringensis]